MSVRNSPRPITFIDVSRSDIRSILYVMGSLLAPLAVGMAFGFTGPSIDTMRNTMEAPGGQHIDIGSNTNLHVFSNSTQMAFLLAAPTSACGYIIVGVGEAPWLLVLGRALEGISIGVCSFNGAVYIQEVSPSDLRGVFGSCTQLITIVGMIVIYGLGMGVRTQANSEDPSPLQRPSRIGEFYPSFA
ncbi:transporter [Perkinsus olseni]|uniref:Transporter n=1 Tax=Perkinsus olseni TaxID=32597 RepID=A0A7J6PBU2_PEROL|nr:transporter [Perkinsus olseni]